MNPDKEKSFEKAYQVMIDKSLNQIPIDGLEKLVDPEVMGWGTTHDEEVFDRDAYIGLIKRQEEQAKDLEFYFDRTPLFKRVSEDGNFVFTAERIKTAVKVDKTTNEFTFRYSAVMEYREGQWKLIHWHGSIPSDIEDDTWHVNEWKAEKEKLEKLVAEQTADLRQKNRELEIEAASERVRSVAMGMQQPDDILKVLDVIRQELGKFELQNIGTWAWIFNDDNTLTQWDISETALDGNLNNVNITLDLGRSESARKHQPLWKDKDYYTLLWQGAELRNIIEEVKELDPESGKMFEEAVNSGKMDTYRQVCAPFSRGVLGLDYAIEPIAEVQAVLTKMSSAFDMAYRRFEDLQKAEAQAKEARIELSLERIRAHVSAMHESSELLDIVVTMRREFVSLGYEAHYFWYMRWHEEHYEKAMTSGDGSKIGMVMTLPRIIHSEIASVAAWEDGNESTMVLAMDTEMAVDYVDKMISLGNFEQVEPQAPTLDDIRQIGGLTFVMARTSLGEIGYSLPGVVPDPPQEALNILERFAGVFDLAYRRFEDLKKAEYQAYESKVEASLERVRGMAAAMNHSDDLMQIAEAMFKEMEILKINPLRYGLGMIDGDKKEAELWASTVDDGSFLDVLGTLSLSWHPMLQQVLEAWDAQYEELIYELKGRELSDYYDQIGKVNPDIPNLKALQDPDTDIVQYVNFFPFKTGALYAFTDGKPSEEGRSILKRFAAVFEQAHIRYEDLQTAEKQERMIREERDRLEIALKELEATKDQLVQQEKLASLGQLTAGIAHEIKNPLNFVNNFSELSVELIEETIEELQAVSNELSEADRKKIHEALDILSDIDMNLRKIHEHGSRADSIVKSMLEHSRGGTGEMQLTDLNSLIKEFVNLSFHGMRAGKDPINVDIDLRLDKAAGEVPLIAEDFSRVIINLCNNSFDAMRSKLHSNGHISGTGEYKPILTVRSFKENGKVMIEIEDNGSGIPEEMKDKIMQPFFTTKKGTEGTGLGLSITNDIVQAHGGVLKVTSEEHKGTLLTIQL